MTWDLIDDYKGERFVPFNNKYFDMNQLKMDEYFFVTTANSSVFDNIDDVYLYTLNKECLECPYVFLDKSITNISKLGRKFRLAKNYKEYYPEDDTSQIICDLDPDFRQFGIYNIKIENDKLCSVDVIKEPVNAYFTIFTVFLIHLLGFALIYLANWLWSKRKNRNRPIDNHVDKSNKKNRVMSIDTFRGISIVIMIFVNYGAGGYDFLDHTTWNGFHLADLVFPWFMWIMGCCIPISLKSSFKNQTSNKELMWNVFKRSLKLFLLGIFLNSGSNLYSIRIFGVLQRFGLCYFIVTTICIFTINTHLISGAEQKYRSQIMNYTKDIVNIWIPWLISLIIILVYVVLIFMVAAPNCPKGYLGPGGLHKNRTMEHCIGGATGYIDKLILGNHIYQYPTIYHVYEARPFDPEGIVGCLPTIVHVVLGVQAGVTLLTFKSHYQRIGRWLTWSTLLGVIGGTLSGFSKEDGLIPLNKNLWSLSFVCITCSLAFLLLSICYILIDMTKWWSGKPLIFAGMNAIILYIGHEVTDGHFPSRWYWYSDDRDDNWRRTHFLALLSDLCASDFWLIVSYYLYKINYFFTI